MLKAHHCAVAQSQVCLGEAIPQAARNRFIHLRPHAHRRRCARSAADKLEIVRWLKIEIVCPPIQKHTAMTRQALMLTLDRQWWRCGSPVGSATLFQHIYAASTEAGAAQLVLARCSEPATVHGDACCRLRRPPTGGSAHSTTQGAIYDAAVMIQKHGGHTGAQKALSS